MALERVQKILAQVGIASRRKAEEMITEGLVTINGKLAKLGDKADLETDAVKVKGKLLRTKEAHVYYAFYKPKGVISMMADPEGRPTLAEYLGKVHARVFPVGRLDFMSEGLILLTNNGAFAEKMQKMDGIPRVYHIKVRGRPEPSQISRLQKGGKIGNRLVRPHSIRLAEELANKIRIEAVFTDAGAIDVKGLFDLKGFLVESIRRTAIGQITLRGLDPGQWRPLKESQVLAITDHPELGLIALSDKGRPNPETRGFGYRMPEGKRERNQPGRNPVDPVITAKGEKPPKPTYSRGPRPDSAAPPSPRPAFGGPRPVGADARKSSRPAFGKPRPSAGGSTRGPRPASGAGGIRPRSAAPRKPSRNRED